MFSQLLLSNDKNYRKNLNSTLISLIAEEEEGINEIYLQIYYTKCTRRVENSKKPINVEEQIFAMSGRNLKKQ